MAIPFASADKEERAQALAGREWRELIRAIQKRAAEAAEMASSLERTSSEETGGEYATLDELNRVARILRELLERNPNGPNPCSVDY